MVQVNALLVIFLIFFLASSGMRWTLARINRTYLRRHGHNVPDVFQGEIDEETLTRITDYTIDSSRFRSFASFFDDIVLLVILLSGFLPWFVAILLSYDLHFIISGLIFFAVVSLIGLIFELPFGLYNTFVIEKRYGFSTTSVKLWFSDLVKSIVISAILGGVLLGGFFALIYYAKTTWWFWGWLLFATFQFLILWLYPIVIAPLFHKHEPIHDEELRDRIVTVMEKAGLKIKGVYQIDAGKRSRHTNAYFTGIGKTKRIVLFDTLLASHTHEEILSVLAHEIGHWKKRHILKQLIFIELLSFSIFCAVYYLADWSYMYETFGFDGVVIYVGIFLLSALFKPLSFFFTPIMSTMSRKFEEEADSYSRRLIGSTHAMVNALKRLAKDNLANLHPHPLFAWFYYSHPPLVNRIRRLIQMEKT